MKRSQRLALASVTLSAFAAVGFADSNVADHRKFSWAENVGWLNWKDANISAPPGQQQGARIYRTLATGFVWGENIGWINLGNINTAVGGTYANTTGLNFGVNIDFNTGVCSGYAWGENVGWINFNTVPTQGAQGARYDRFSGRFTGYAWGENIGWINLDDADKYICALQADLNGDGVVNTLDLTRFLGSFGAAIVVGERGDLNADGVVNTIDLTAFLGQFGRTCQ